MLGTSWTCVTITRLWYCGTYIQENKYFHNRWYFQRPKYFHDRYDMDFDDDVLYCYEIQLEESCRGKGLGKFMMKVLQTVLMPGIFITIHKTNSYMWSLVHLEEMDQMHQIHVVEFWNTSFWTQPFKRYWSCWPSRLACWRLCSRCSSTTQKLWPFSRRWNDMLCYIYT